MSKFCPPGVRYFTYAAQSTKGSKHPDSLNAGQPTVEFISGSHPAIKPGKGNTGHTPAGVHEHSGAEDYVKVNHKAAARSGPSKKAGQDARPEGVRVFGDNVKKK